MTMNDIIALAGAGFTKADIMSLMNSQTTVPYQTPAPAPAPAPAIHGNATSSGGSDGTADSHTTRIITGTAYKSGNGWTGSEPDG